MKSRPTSYLQKRKASQKKRTRSNKNKTSFATLADLLTPRRKVYLGIFVVIFLVVYLFALRPLVKVYASANAIKDGGRRIARHIQAQDFERIQDELDDLEKEVKGLEKTANRYQYLSFVPGASIYFEDAPHITNAGVHGIAMARIVFEALEPHSEELSAEGGEASNKLVTAVRVLPAILPRFDEISAEFHLVREALDNIDPQEYPETIQGREVRSQLEFALETTRQFDDSMPEVEAFLGQLPEFLGDGEAGDKRYLVLFQNNGELRPSGGFLTSYALITLREGNVAEVISADTFDLDQRIGLITDPHPVLSRLLKVDHWFARDANFSPDYVESADKFMEYWQMVPNPEVDGVFAIDTEVPARFLEVLGPITLEGYEEEFDHENVIDVMSNRARELREQPGRKALIGLLLGALETKIFDASQEQWVPLGISVLEMLHEKHILLYSFDPDVQSFFEAFNFSGRLRPYAGDYLHINDANLAGGKANFNLEQTVTKEMHMDADRLFTNLTIEYHNTGEYDQESNPGYQSYTRILVPQGAQLLSSEGSVEEVLVDEEWGKTVFTAVNQTAPLEKSQLKFEYMLPAGTLSLDNYSLLVQKQPGTPGHTYTIRGADQSITLDLDSDQEVRF